MLLLLTLESPTGTSAEALRPVVGCKDSHFFVMTQK